MEIHAIKAFYTAREGLVELEDDALSIVRQVREQYGDKVKITWEPDSEDFVFIEKCEDGTERLIFTCKELDGRALERLFLADKEWWGYEDTYDKQEKAQDEEFQRRDEEKLDSLRDGGERLAHALKKDGIRG